MMAAVADSYYFDDYFDDANIAADTHYGEMATDPRLSSCSCLDASVGMPPSVHTLPYD